jgi:lipoate-protein ligase A
MPAVPNPTWLFWKSKPLSGALNMAWDDLCLKQSTAIGAPLLRFYCWTRPTTTFGYFQKHEAVREIEASTSLIRRPTGGGIVPHSSDWTYSLVFPPTSNWYRIRAKESYVQLHQWIQLAFSLLNIESQLNPISIQEGPGSCFVGAEESDLLYKGKKLAGAAQRRSREGFLIQGSIQPPFEFVERSDWEKALRQAAVEAWGIQWKEWIPPSTFAEQVSELAHSKYESTKHNQRR